MLVVKKEENGIPHRGSIYQLGIFPESIEDYVAKDVLVRGRDGVQAETSILAT